MGGTFDPIHIAHLIAATEVQETLGLDQVIFIPAGQPWQKSQVEITPAQQRLEMVNLAIKGNAKFISSDIEIIRPGATYAIDTVKQLMGDNPENEYFWIVGADALRGMPTWHNFAELKELITIVAVNRNGISAAEVDFPYTFVQIPEVDISATEIRTRVNAGKAIQYLVPDAVCDYIAETGLDK